MYVYTVGVSESVLVTPWQEEVFIGGMLPRQRIWHASPRYPLSHTHDPSSRGNSAGYGQPFGCVVHSHALRERERERESERERQKERQGEIKSE